VAREHSDVARSQRIRGEGFVVLARVLSGRLGRAAAVATVAIAVVALGGCGGISSTVKPETLRAVAPPAALNPAVVPNADQPSGTPERVAGGADMERTAETTEAPVVPSEPAAVQAATDGAESDTGGVQVAQTPLTPPTPPTPPTEVFPGDDEDSDPWERFNEKVFEFNRQADRFVLKPVAKAYSFLVPEPFQVMIGNGFDNISFVPRFVNSLLQGKFGGATRELSRFLINSTAGIGGLFDAAKYWGIEKSREDFGQTLGVWGVSPGPYLIVPFMEPMTVRDGIGRGVDSFMNPLSYFIPFLWTGVSLRLGEIVNDRALNLELFQGFEESVVDLYSAVRHGYLRRREQLIKE